MVTQALTINALARVLQQLAIDEREVLQWQIQADQSSQNLFQMISQHHLIDAEKFMQACAAEFQLPIFTLENQAKNNMPLDALPLSLMKKNLWMCVAKKNNVLIVAISNPDDIENAKTLSFQLNTSVELVFARYDFLYRLHNHYISEQCYQSEDAKQITHQLFSDAIHRNASDIHIEPYQNNCRVRFRLDGLLHEILQFPNALTDAITSCIKVLAQLDIAIKRMPQDGRITFRTPLKFVKDCRVSTCPTMHNEKIVVRLLDANTHMRTIDELGLSSHDQKIILNTLQQPQGLILVTGPTGSGKTMTLYTLLQLLNKSHRNIATIEDPIEMQIDGINQTAVHAKNGLTFSHTLRTLLRQDPDVMMIGEIRDQETADMAIRAAQTGHLVLSTLHTNSAAEAITRLCHMGIAPYHLNSALTLVIAQRLVRCICNHCKQKNNCAHCTDGFSGRKGIFELLPMKNNIKELILETHSHQKISEKNKINGQEDLWQAALNAVKQEITTLNEIYRVIPYEK